MRSVIVFDVLEDGVLAEEDPAVPEPLGGGNAEDEVAGLPFRWWDAPREVLDTSFKIADPW